MPRVDGAFTLRDALFRARDLYGEDDALICGDTVRTWSELAQRASQAARWLRSLGVGRGDRVIMLSDNRAEVVEAAYGVAMLGAALVPLSPIAATAEIMYTLEDAEAVIGLYPPALAGLVEDAEGRWVPFADPSYEDGLASQDQSEPPIVETPDDVVLQFYTSGTTGRSKGVLVSQGALVAHGLNTALSQGLSHDDVFLTCAPMTHAAGGTRIFSLATEAVKHVILPRWRAEAFEEAVDRFKVTTTVVVPSMLSDLAEDEGLDPDRLSSLRLVVYGAAPTPPKLLEAVLHRLPDVGFMHSYGISEAGTALTALGPDEHRGALADPALRDRLRSVGRPVPGVRFRIADTEGAPLPATEVGEVQVRSAKVMSGYWHQPEDERSPWCEGWLATGDLGYLDAAGYLYLVGRSKEMVISGGLNVYPAEIELALLDLEQVREAAVVGVDHPRYGETPVAFVVLDGDASPEDLRAHCRARLARYKLPSEFFIVEDLPRTDTGKVRKSVLKAEARAASARGTEHTGAP